MYDPAFFHVAQGHYEKSGLIFFLDLDYILYSPKISVWIIPFLDMPVISREYRRVTIQSGNPRGQRVESNTYHATRDPGPAYIIVWLFLLPTITPVAKSMAVSALDQHCSDTRSGEVDETHDVTPLPWGQLLIVLLIQFAEPITAIVIFPFINQMVRETGVTGGDETKTGYFAGIIVRTRFCNHIHYDVEMAFQESVFFIAEATTTVFWGMASDRFGRRSVLIFGPLGLSITMLGFGASTQFSSLVIFRLFQGVFNGNMGLSLSRCYL